MVEDLIKILTEYAEVVIEKQESGKCDGYLIKMPPVSCKEYYFGYLMYLPFELRNNPVLLIEGPACSPGDLEKANELVYKKALFELSQGGFPRYLAHKVKCPLIMPLIPRLIDDENNTNIYSHALTSRAMNTKVYPIERADLQLINMFKDIKKLFLSAKIYLYDKFIISGFSAGGVLAHRFTILHPEYVFTAISGGAIHSFTLPLEQYKDEILLYPNGIGNTQIFCEFDFDEYKKVPQFFYMGDEDFNDPVPYNDSYTEEERQQIYRLFGEVGMPDRWNLFQDICKSLNLDNIIFKTYKGVDHRQADEAWDFIEKYVFELLQNI